MRPDIATTEAPPAMKPHIRWMIRIDHPQVYGIERLSFDDPWGEAEYLPVLRRRDCIGMVAEGNAPAEGSYPILGAMVYQLHKDRIELLRLAVHPDCRRLGVGLALLDKLAGKLSPHRRSAITLAVPDTNLDAHLWLRACGFRAVAVERGEGDARDRYRFEHRLPAPDAEWRSTRWRERACDLVRAAFPRGLARDSVLNALHLAAPEARALPDPRADSAPDGGLRLTWSSGDRSVFLHSGATWGATLTVAPLPFPSWIHECATTPEALGRALDWAFGTGAPAPAPSPADAEDRSC